MQIFTGQAKFPPLTSCAKKMNVKQIMNIQSNSIQNVQ